MEGQAASLLTGLLTPKPCLVMPVVAPRRLTTAALATLSLSAASTALLPPTAGARPWPIPAVSSWWRPASSDGYGYGYGQPINSAPNQAYGAPPLTPEQQIQRCNTGRFIGGLGGGAVAYALSRDDGRAWAIPLGALLGSQVGCNAAAGRGPLPW